LDTSLDKVAQCDLGFPSTNGLTVLAEALGRAGRIAEGLALVEAGIEQFEANYVTPELVRLKGELSLLQGRPGAAGSAEIHFRQALMPDCSSVSLHAISTAHAVIGCSGRSPGNSH
jgi:hypothetical protein